MVPALMALLVRWLPSSLDAEALLKQQATIDIVAIAIAITVVTAVFTVAIGCITVVVMKGPQYTADSYDLRDSERPLDSPRDD
jgi:hypothetical protein